jgi:hypothetical protein
LKRRRRSLIPAQGWSASDNPGKIKKTDSTLKGLLRVEPLQGWVDMLMNDPKVVASSNLGLELANAFGVFLCPISKSS